MSSFPVGTHRAPAMDTGGTMLVPGSPYPSRTLSTSSLLSMAMRMARRTIGSASAGWPSPCGLNAPSGFWYADPEFMEHRADERGENPFDLTARREMFGRMATAIGNEVVALRRVRFASLRLGGLPEGRSRPLRPAEVRRLWKDARP